MRLSDVDARRRRRDFRHVKRRNRLIEQHLFLLRPTAIRVLRRLTGLFDLDELMADGAVGLLRAAARFDRARGVPFGPFASRYVRGEMIEGVRRRRVAMFTLGCDAIAPDEVARNDARLDARTLLALIRSPRRRLVLVLRFLEELEMKRVAREMEVTEARVSQLVKHTLRGLRKHVA